MTAWFRANELESNQDNVETAKHQHFIEKLDEAYDIVFPEPAKASLLREVPAQADVQTTNSGFASSFGILEDTPTVSPTRLTDAELQNFLDTWASSSLDGQSQIKDDPFEEIFAFYQYVLEMDYMATFVKNYSSMAARGTMAVPFAAQLTNVGCAAVKDICETYQDVGGITTRVLAEQYLQKKAQMQIALGEDMSQKEAARSGDHILYNKYSAGSAFLTPTMQLNEAQGLFSTAMNDPEKFMERSKDKPTSFFLSPKQEQAEELAMRFQTWLAISDLSKLDLPEHEATVVLDLYNISRSLMQVYVMSMANEITGVLAKEAEAVANPLLAEISIQVACGGMPRTELAFGLNLLLETGKSFFYINDQPNPTNLRLKALQLANEVKKSIWAIIERETNLGESRNVQPSTFYALQNKFQELDEYTRTPVFDLYHQMPWTAGSQMSETLHSALDFGLGLCRTRDIFGQMLHGYNLVRQISPDTTKPLPFLEALCDLFLDQVFLGQRPTKNFKNIMLRFIGAKLDKESKKKTRGMQKPKHYLGAPESLADGAAENQRLKAHELSLFYDLRSYSPPFCGGGSFRSRVLTGGGVRTVTPKQNLAMDRKIHDVPFALTLERIREAVTAESGGPLPTAKMDFFAIYGSAVQVMDDVAVRYQRNLPRELLPYQALNLLQPPPADACGGTSFVFAAMDDADIKREKFGANVDLSHHGGIKHMWEAYEKCYGERTVKDFMWKTC